MAIEAAEISANSFIKPSEENPQINDREKRRMIVHLSKMFARRYDLKVIPSGTKGLWACSTDPKYAQDVQNYVLGQRETLDDLPQEAFEPKQILYDAESAKDMSMEEIQTLLHHEAGHYRFTDFKAMVEGQKAAKDEGNLPTSYWLTFEGIEDPRVNSREGDESPAIDAQIRKNQAKDLQDRLTESPLKDRPLMLQFAYDSFHYWLHGEGIEEIKDTDVGKALEVAKPLLDQYFQNTDVSIRKILQKQIWDIAKPLEKQDIEDEKKRQMSQKMNQQQGQGQGQPGQGGGQSQGEEQGGSGQGEQIAPPSIPGGKGQSSGGGSSQEMPSQNQQQKGFMDRLKESIFGPKDKQQTNQDIQKPKPKRERMDLSKLTPEQLQQIKDAIDRLTPEEFAQLEKQARQQIDEEQKEALEEELGKTMKLEKDKQTGEYQVVPQMSNEGQQKKAEGEYQKVEKEVEAEEQAEWAAQEQARQIQDALFRKQEELRRQKTEMEKAGFEEDELDKFLLYQDLERSMYGYVRKFKQAIEKVVPRRKEPKYEPGFFSGPKFDRREVIRKAPIGNEQFWQRQVDAPTGEPRLFIGLLVDNSGSMEGKKMEEARKTMVFFSKVCSDMGIPFMMASFGDDAEVVKTFRQEFEDPKERVKPKVIDATDASGSTTNMFSGIEVTIKAMNEQRRKIPDCHGLIFVITDGDANAGKTGQNLQDYIEENRGRLTFKGFGLSGDPSERQRIQNYLNLYFGESNSAYPQNFEDLPDEAFRLLRINLMQFQRFLS